MHSALMEPLASTSTSKNDHQPEFLMVSYYAREASLAKAKWNLNHKYQTGQPPLITIGKSRY